MRIVFTGGPSAGKTTIVQIIEREFKEKISQVPESANILFKGGFPRSTETVDLIHQQKAIYFLQAELEAMIAERNFGKSIICDRGSLDGCAYWPDNAKIDFFQAVNTTLEKEIARYDWVFHLETSPSFFYDTTNPVRLESYDQAKVIDEKVKSVWAQHPRQIIIHNAHTFSYKVQIVLNYINQLLEHGTINKK